MKKLEKTCRKAGPKPPDITRHYTELRPEETRDVVERLADLIVDFVKIERCRFGKGQNARFMPVPKGRYLNRFGMAAPTRRRTANKKCTPSTDG